MNNENRSSEQGTEQKELAIIAEQRKEAPLSEKIGGLLDAFANVKEVYATSNEHVQHMDRLTQDLLHALELQENTYHERARIAKALHDCRAQRRPYKDNVYTTEPIAGYLKSKKGQALLAQLEHVQKLAQNIERSAPGRKYNPRVLTLEEYRDVAKKQPRKQRLKLHTQNKAEQEAKNG